MCCKSSDSWILLCNNDINHVFAHSFALGGATHPAERKKEETRAEMLMQPPPHMRSDMKKMEEKRGKEKMRVENSLVEGSNNAAASRRVRGHFRCVSN